MAKIIDSVTLEKVTVKCTVCGGEYQHDATGLFGMVWGDGDVTGYCSETCEDNDTNSREMDLVEQDIKRGQGAALEAAAELEQSDYPGLRAAARVIRASF